MIRLGFPCGACKFLRKKCVRGCIFAPYFCYKQGVTHFSAVHKIFGAGNVSKLLAQVPVSDRSKVAATISYEVQARLEDPIYGICSYILTLQQQVVNLQTQLASLKELQAAQNFLDTSVDANPNEKCYGIPSYPQDVQSLFQSGSTNYMMPQFSTNNISNNASTISYDENVFMQNSFGNRGSSLNSEENASNVFYEELVAVGYIPEEEW